MKRRTLLLGSAAAAACTLPFAWAQQGAADRWRLLVNEAVTADLSISMLAMRYRNLADYLGAQIHQRQVLVDPIIDIQRFVQQALGDNKPLLVYGKSVNQLAKLVRDHGYQPLVRRPEPYQAAFIVPKDSPIGSLAQLSGRKLLLPDTYSATAAVARAELRRQNIAEPFMSHTRFQDSVAIQVATGIAEAGVVNPTIARKWRESGGRVIGETQPVVNWSVLAAPKVPADVVARLTESLVGMKSPTTEPILAEIGVKQWVKADRKDYIALLEYTGE
jgi:ABC-type phosphate/phosphonate transport system substrate-binding protein